MHFVLRFRRSSWKIRGPRLDVTVISDLIWGYEFTEKFWGIFIHHKISIVWKILNRLLEKSMKHLHYSI